METFTEGSETVFAFLGQRFYRWDERCVGVGLGWDSRYGFLEVLLIDCGRGGDIELVLGGRARLVRISEHWAGMGV